MSFYFELQTSNFFELRKIHNINKLGHRQEKISHLLKNPPSSFKKGRGESLSLLNQSKFCQNQNAAKLVFSKKAIVLIYCVYL